MNKINPKYTQMVTQWQNRIDGVRKNTVLKNHLCTEEDFAKFYPPSSTSSISIKNAIARGNLYCLDNPEEVKQFGEENGDFGRFAALVLPCNFGLEPGEVPADNPECTSTQAEQTEWMNQLNFIYMYNNERFDQNEFGEDRIRKESEMSNQQLDHRNPNWFEIKMNRKTLEDETQYIKLGTPNSVNFLSYTIGMPE